MALLNDLFSRLCRRTVRRGYAFPALPVYELSEATPREVRGTASSKGSDVTESRRLSGVRGGKDALRFNVLLVLFFITGSAS